MAQAAPAKKNTVLTAGDRAAVAQVISAAKKAEAHARILGEKKAESRKAKIKASYGAKKRKEVISTWLKDKIAAKYADKRAGAGQAQKAAKVQADAELANAM